MPPPHGIMFHHFHDANHPRGQGAMSADDLDSMIRFLGRDRILPAQVWLQRTLAGTLQDGDLCLTFDDNLRCQFDVALPVLDRHGITAFWFVYTSVLQQQLERLELYRLFRTLYFPSVDDFYAAFFTAINESPDAEDVRALLASFRADEYLAEFPFYTPADRTFRFVRDHCLKPSRYQATMEKMMQGAGASASQLARRLWMDAGSLRELHRQGHVIGLHSHTHPTRLGDLPPRRQQFQYITNHAVLTEILGQKPTAMSHPCNSYSTSTVPILQSLGVRLGFRANMAQSSHGPLEFPREDHANLLKRMAA